MKLWILRPIEDWTPWYDKAFGFVIRASSEVEARRIASSKTYGDEGGAVWRDCTLTTCKRISVEGEAELIMEDFHAA